MVDIKILSIGTTSAPSFEGDTHLAYNIYFEMNTCNLTAAGSISYNGRDVSFSDAETVVRRHLMEELEQ